MTTIQPDSPDVAKRRSRMDAFAIGWTVASVVALVVSMVLSNVVLAEDSSSRWIVQGAAAASLGSLVVSVIHLKEVLPRRLQRFDEAAFGRSEPRIAIVRKAESTFADGQPTLQLELLVRHSSGDSYPVRVALARDDRREQLTTSGSEVYVRVHPGDPQRIRVDWDLTSARVPDIAKRIDVVSLRCASCGADLTLGNATSVVCQYCHTENHVVRS
ncbi:MAG: hypothetical protein RIF41_26780 [Polyangiaceae bacterium]